nr:MAG TPA: hypothetical protein [Bacteriophage sp.]
MKITHIFAQNFCKFYGKNTLDTDFSMKTVLSGQNEDYTHFCTEFL